jgi:hypothetical protein
MVLITRYIDYIVELCAVRKRFDWWTKYSAATLAFSRTVQDVRSKIGTSQNGKYGQLERILSAARVKSQQARVALDQNMAAHGRSSKADAQASSVMP